MTHEEMFKLAVTIAAPIIAKKANEKSAGMPPSAGLVQSVYAYLCNEYSRTTPRLPLKEKQ